MFRIITNLLFGVEDKPTENVQSAEVVEEEWHVVTHQDAVVAEDQDVALLDQVPNSAVPGATVSQQEANASEMPPETPVQRSNATSGAVPGALHQPKALAEAAQCTCVQKAKAWAERHSFSRNSIQRQNRIRHGIQHQAFHLHQPGHRNLSH